MHSLVYLELGRAREAERRAARIHDRDGFAAGPGVGDLWRSRGRAPANVRDVPRASDASVCHGHGFDPSLAELATNPKFKDGSAATAEAGKVPKDIEFHTPRGTTIREHDAVSAATEEP